MKKKRLLSTAIAGTLAAAIIVGGGTFAYLKAQSNNVKNTFTANTISVSVAEENGNNTSGKQYTILPGTTDTKDPKVTVDTTVDAFVFVKVTDTINTNLVNKDVVDYSIAAGWQELDSVATATEKVYYRTVNAADPEKSWSVLNGDTITYVSTYNNDKTTLGTLDFEAYVIQKVQDGTTDFNAADAYAAAIAE